MIDLTFGHSCFREKISISQIFKDCCVWKHVLISVEMLVGLRDKRNKSILDVRKSFRKWTASSFNLETLVKVSIYSMYVGGREAEGKSFFLRSSFVELEWEEKVEINKLNPRRTILLLLCKVRTGSRRAIVMAFVLVGLLYSNSKGSK